MSVTAMLIDYEFCSGCHACEMACKIELGLKEGQFGIKVAEVGPFQIGEKEWQYDFVPVLTDMCDFCADRVAQGKIPSCQHHCQALAIEVGPIEELVPKMTGKTKMVIYTPKASGVGPDKRGE